MEEADNILREVTDLLMEHGCTVNKPAMLELAIYVIKREKKVLEGMRLGPVVGSEQPK